MSWISQLLEIFPCCPTGAVSRKKSRSKDCIKPEPTVVLATEVSQLQGLFTRFADVASRELDANQLHSLLNNSNGLLQINFPFDGFSFDSCRAMVASRDINHSGKLGYTEFEELWRDIQTWKEVFEKYDEKQLGYFDKEEFEEIFKSLDMVPSERTVKVLAVRYSNKAAQVHFGDFVAATLRFKVMAEAWKERSAFGQSARFSADEFIQLAIYT